MFDYFRLEPSWPGNIKISGNPPATQKAQIIESTTLSKIKGLFPNHNVERRLIPYIEMHEFEALLFSDTSILAEKIGVSHAKIKDILEECGEPEEINDGPNTAPSKRLIGLKSGYRKVAMGETITKAISIQTIRKKCTHFNEWLISLEQLAAG